MSVADESSRSPQGKAPSIVAKTRHSRRTSAGVAEASASTVGKRSMKRSQRVAARSAWVCWAIASETSTAYGSRVRRKASVRPFAWYQSRIASRTSGANARGPSTPRRIATVQPVITAG
jgi:hypothetical protein